MERTVQRTIKVLNQVEKQDPDLLEIRLDQLRDTSSISEIRKATDRVIIATNRPKDERGFFSGKEEARLRSLFEAAEAGFDYVDVDLNTKSVSKLVDQLNKDGAETIVSYHNHMEMPGPHALESILKREKTVGADICKIVTTARSYEDNLSSLIFLNKHAKKTKLVCFAMGRMGIPSRVLSPVYGAYFTFASSGLGRQTAAGQMPLSRLRAIYEEFGIS
jgi:3-dehydroquinate dehydratase type I